ncbi:MAG: PAS domain-containing sensor histidine kinase [Chloroflexi bacterium]|nr:PAS domain-containing sensor histidine kinase [Chloroflexota bacterium]
MSLEPILDRAPCGFLSLDESGTVRLANTTLAELLGFPRDAIEGQSMDRLLPAAGRIFHTTHLFPLLRLHGRAEEIYIPLRTASGEEIPVLVNGVLRRQDGETFYDLIVVPMRQRHELENELIAARNMAQEATRSKDQFLSVVSHELRTPLTAVSGYADLLLRESRGPLTEPQRDYVARIAAAARYQVGLIEAILEFASLDGRMRLLDPSPVDVESALTGAMALLSVRAAKEEHDLRREPTPALGTALADPQALQQIVLNLGVNAIKFSEPGSPVLVRSEVAEDRIRISVQDSGRGIAASDVERIFDPFVQLEASDAGYAVRGVGLGLPISRELARGMGGDITVDSVVGSGSTFTVDLPRAR